MFVSVSLQRHDDRRKEIEGMMAIVAKGDALDRASVDKIFAGGASRHGTCRGCLWLLAY
jgi:hypothetical protein